MAPTVASPEATKKNYNIAIVGGGIGGLCLSIGLLRKGISIQIYEAAHAFAEIGAGVGFGANATKSMYLISPDIREAYDHIATNNWSENKGNIWFDFLVGHDLENGGRAGDFITGLSSPKGQSSVHRAHFLDELVKLIPPGVAHFGKKLVDYDTSNPDSVTLTFADGTKASHSALIGCDGIKSRTRQILLGEKNHAANAVFSGKYAYRGLIPMEEATAALGDDLARNSHMYLGKHGHVLTFPVDHGKTMNVVAFRTKADGVWDDSAWVKPVKKEEMEADFDNWGPRVKSILSMIKKPDVWALFDHPLAESFTKGRVCLLGDAAHATTPHQGSGAGMAIEDALFLSNLLDLVESVDDISKAFSVYDEYRRPRTQKVVTTSRLGGSLYEMELPGVEDSVDRIRENLLTRMTWIWEEDLEAAVQSARKSLLDKLPHRSAL
ncbi:hypothetical protein B0O99DRAFT_657989 [Bisporella sp. PMI_857]|nr:hypothetical protein B0O99DRAFT_657989 [Bisporella sp. PMI_857]